MSEETKTGTQSYEEVQKHWLRPVNRLGRISLVLVMIACYIPFLYLYLEYRQFPEIGAAIVGLISVTLAFGPAWFIEPASYFPALGTAGSYIGILAGSIAQMRVPSALVAKSVAETSDGTQEAEIVATSGIIGSVFMNIIILIITVTGGSYLISIFPKVVMATLSAYVLPAIMGAVMAMFSGGTKIRSSLTTLLAGLILAWIVGSALASARAAGVSVPAWVGLMQMPVCIVIGVLIFRLQYNRERVKK